MTPVLDSSAPAATAEGAGEPGSSPPDEAMLLFLGEKLHAEMERLDPRGSMWAELPVHRREFYVACAERVIVEYRCQLARLGSGLPTTTS
jgi:hypothetical protein